MFFARRPVLENEQERLISAAVRARKQMRELNGRHLYLGDGMTATIPVILAELRFRFLLTQARRKNWNNMWELD